LSFWLAPAEHPAAATGASRQKAAAAAPKRWRLRMSSSQVL
jgi:hypothetical protein